MRRPGGLRLLVRGLRDRELRARSWAMLEVFVLGLWLGLVSR